MYVTEAATIFLQYSRQQLKSAVPHITFLNKMQGSLHITVSLPPSSESNTPFFHHVYFSDQPVLVLLLQNILNSVMITRVRGLDFHQTMPG